MVLRRLFLSIKTKVSVFSVLWISLTACNICQRAISKIIIHQSMLYELLSNLIGSLLLYYAAYDGFSLKSLHRNSAEVSTTVLFELICLRLQASLILVVLPRSAQLAHAKFQQGRQLRVGQSFAIEFQDFMN